MNHSNSTALSIRDRYRLAPDFDAYLDTVEKNRELWYTLTERASIDEETIARARAIPGTWHLLALSEDWCGDAVNTLPMFNRLSEAVSGIDLKVLGRDENLDLMDAHLTNGASRSIPVVITYDADFRERGWWGPRPGPLQDWVMAEGMQLESGPRYREVRRYYARDRGRTTIEEFLALLEHATAAS